MGTKIFADGANIDEILKLNEVSYIQGFTTNPTLLRKAGVTNYEEFAVNILKHVKEKPISFEVFADDLTGMIDQAFRIADWGNNVYVKIPIMNSKGEYTIDALKYLSRYGIKVNATAIMTFMQAKMVSDCIENNTPCIISIFAGRLFDIGIDATKVLLRVKEYISNREREGQRINQELLWASPRQVYDYELARKNNIDIITMTPQLIEKWTLLKNKRPEQYSLETCQMFYNDAKEAGYKI